MPTSAYFTGMSVALVAIFMFFMALVSAYMVRKGQGDWQAVKLPAVVWANTLVLIGSSLTIERARRMLKEGSHQGFRIWWRLTTTLGLLFLVGQVIAWQQLAAAGVFLSSNPASSFFYLLTGAHGLHLLGGVAALLYVLLRSWNRARVPQGVAVDVTSTYWHFMDGLWVFLVVIFYLGR